MQDAHGRRRGQSASLRSRFKLYKGQCLLGFETVPRGSEKQLLGVRSLVHAGAEAVLDHAAGADVRRTGQEPDPPGAAAAALAGTEAASGGAATAR